MSAKHECIVVITHMVHPNKINIKEDKDMLFQTNKTSVFCVSSVFDFLFSVVPYSLFPYFCCMPSFFCLHASRWCGDPLHALPWLAQQSDTALHHEMQFSQHDIIGRGTADSRRCPYLKQPSVCHFGNLVEIRLRWAIDPCRFSNESAPWLPIIP